MTFVIFLSSMSSHMVDKYTLGCSSKCAHITFKWSVTYKYIIHVCCFSFTTQIRKRKVIIAICSAKASLRKPLKIILLATQNMQKHSNTKQSCPLSNHWEHNSNWFHYKSPFNQIYDFQHLVLIFNVNLLNIDTYKIIFPEKTIRQLTLIEIYRRMQSLIFENSNKRRRHESASNRCW